MMIKIVDETTGGAPTGGEWKDIEGTIGEVTIDMEFGPNQWWIPGVTPVRWILAGHPESGHFAPDHASPQTIILSGESTSAAARKPFLSLSNMRLYESKSSLSGTGRFLNTDGHPTGNQVKWSRRSGAPSPLSDVRRILLQFLEAHVPRTGKGITSDDPKFNKVSGLTTAALRNIWKNDPRFTSCNSFAGGVAQKLHGLLKIKGRSWTLGAGKLELNQLDKEVPGCWTAPKDSHGNVRYPRPGDFYSKPKPDQPFAHVGIVYSVDGEFESLDGGQDWKPAGKPDKWIGVAKWLRHGPVESFNFTGWIDLDMYCSSTPVPRRRTAAVPRIF